MLFRSQLWSKVASFPALFVQSTGTHYPPRDIRGLPPRRTITAELWVYTDVGKDPNANPEQALNDIIDAVEAALAPGIVALICDIHGNHVVLFKGEWQLEACAKAFPRTRFVELGNAAKRVD